MTSKTRHASYDTLTYRHSHIDSHTDTSAQTYNIPIPTHTHVPRHAQTHRHMPRLTFIHTVRLAQRHTNMNTQAWA